MYCIWMIAFYFTSLLNLYIVLFTVEWSSIANPINLTQIIQPIHHFTFYLISSLSPLLRSHYAQLLWPQTWLCAVCYFHAQVFTINQHFLSFFFQITLAPSHALQHLFAIKGVLHLLPQKAPKLACFVLYLKIIQIFLKNNICILKKIVQGTQK